MPKSTPQAVIDSNVLVRAVISHGGSDYLIYKTFLAGKFELLYSDASLKELVRVLNYPRLVNKYHFERQTVRDFIDSIVTFGKFVYAPKKVRVCRDPDDDELISIALAIYVRKPILLVTGDKDLLALRGKIKGVKIVTAAKLAKQGLTLK